jgi:selenocysteine-specific elongation factor
VILGTAGHIDHGKSALIEALTGRRMDRLVEERARGITIDLNFAPLVLGDGRVAGVVDVPGHEDFVRTMVAGAAGMDLVLLVIAADEGIMPQTREHLAIAETLRVPRGIPVLTKSDLVDPDWLALVRDDVATGLADSPVRFADPVAVSSTTGAGLDRLRAAIDLVAGQVEEPDASGPFRMPIDRAFSVAGAGTVVTGTVWSGAVGPGETVLILPGARSARVRSIESHGARGGRAIAGGRTALGLAGIDRAEVRRGDVVVAGPLPWQSTTALDVRLDLLPTAPRAITARTRVHLHLGTAEVLARVMPASPIEPGESGLARLACEAPLVARGGDRFVIRSYSPVTTIGGGVVVDPLPPRRRAVWVDGLAASAPARRARAIVARSPAGVPSGELALRSGAAEAALDAALAEDSEMRRVGDDWVLASELVSAASRAREAVRTYHRGHPSQPGMPIETLRRAAHRSASVAEAAIGELAAAGTISLEHGLAALAGFSAGVPGGAAAVDRVVALIEAGRLMPPTVPELARHVEGIDAASALRIAAGAGRVEALGEEWYVSRSALDQFRTVLLEVGAVGEITVATLRERTGLSRKYLIPLLEWADRRGVTRRAGEGRRLT